MFSEFKKFAMRGNVLDLAIGVIIGAAFGKIVSSFVADIVMPPIGLLLGGVDFSHLVITLKQATDTASAVTINYGTFINAILDFLIIGVTIFILVKQVNRFKKHTPPEEKLDPEEVILLREIRDLLKK